MMTDQGNDVIDTEIDRVEAVDENETIPHEKGLGRGLAALFGDDDEDQIYSYIEEEAGERSDASDAEMSYRIMPIEWVHPNRDQPRQHFDVNALKELSDSISVHGIIQPLLVRPIPEEDSSYEIIAGERRWRAAQIAQLHEIPVTIQYLADQDVMELALIENLQREDLTPIEEAEGYQYLIDMYEHTQEKLAASLGKSRSHIANMLRLLTLPDSVKKEVTDGTLSAGHARTLVGAENPEDMARQIIDQNLSVRDAERLKSGGSVSKEKSDRGEGSDSAMAVDSSSQDKKSVDIIALEKELSDLLGLSVEINAKGKSGELLIRYNNLEQMDDILHRLSHNPGRI
jgi:ParB family chromosome partitioning protein